MKADHCDEEAEADGDRVTKRDGDGVHDGLAEATEDEDEDRDALDEDDRHGGVPVTTGELGQREGHDRVDTHAGGAGERTVGEEAHEDGHDACAEAGRGDGCRDRHAGKRHQARVDRDDVRHREERREASANLLTRRRTPVGHLKELFHRRNAPIS